MKTTALLALSLLLVPALSIQAQEREEPTGEEIARMVDQRPDGDDYRARLKMTLINRRGSQRVREMLILSKDYGRDTKSLTYFQEPADVRGTGFLQFEYDDPDVEDDRWLYLPALRKSRRISGSSSNDSFMGSDFTYDDWGDRSVEEDTHTLLRSEIVDGHDCWVVESVPKDENDPYSRTVSTIRKDALIDIHVAFYDHKGELLKTLTVEDIRLVDGIWTPYRMVMENVQDNHRTIIEQQQVTYNNGLVDSLFRVSSLERGLVR